MTDPRHFTDPKWAAQEATRQGIHHEREPYAAAPAQVVRLVRSSPRFAYRVPAWREPNEDGVSRPYEGGWVTEWGKPGIKYRAILHTTPYIPKAQCMRCYPRCFQEIGHDK